MKVVPVLDSEATSRRTFLWQALFASLGSSLARGQEKSSFPALDQLTVAGCSLPNFSFESMLEKVAAMGFAGVELAVFAEEPKPGAADSYPWAVADRLSEAEKARIQERLSAFSRISTHLPYGPGLRPLAADPALRKSARQELRRALDDSALWGAQTANIHILTDPGLPFAEAKPLMIDLYRELGDYAGEKGLRLAIETTRPYAAGEYLEIVHEVANENVGATVDTGHIHFFEQDLPVPKFARSSARSIQRYNDLMMHVVTQLGDKLFHLHLDDARPADWREHFVPGTGIIDWNRLFTYLAQMQYQGALVLELFYYTGAGDSGENLKRAFSHHTTAAEVGAGLEASRKAIAAAIRSTTTAK